MGRRRALMVAWIDRSPIHGFMAAAELQPISQATKSWPRKPLDRWPRNCTPAPFEPDFCNFAFAELRLLHFRPITIDCPATSGSTRNSSKPASRIHAVHSVPL